MRHRATRLLGALLLVASAALLAEAPARGQGAAAPSSEEAQAHYAKGEVRYGDAWIDVDTLFEQYAKVVAEIKELIDKGAPAHQEAQELNRQIYLLRGEALSKERPVRVEISRHRSAREAAARIIAVRPPAAPTPQRLPTRPHRSAYTDSNDYERALDRWQRETDRIESENRRREADYKRQLDALQKAQEQAKQTVAEADAKIRELDQQLEDIKKELADKQLPLLEKQRTLTDQIESLRRQTGVLIGRRELIAKAFAEAPQTVLWRRGIVEWEGTFRRFDELQAHHAQTQAEINRVRDELRRDALEKGRDFPDDWRHPEQDKMDELKALLASIKAARGP